LGHVWGECYLNDRKLDPRTKKNIDTAGGGPEKPQVEVTGAWGIDDIRTVNSRSARGKNRAGGGESSLSPRGGGQVVVGQS